MITEMRRFMRIVERSTGRTGIEGLPDDVEINDKTIRRMINSGRYRLIARPGRREGEYTVEVHPAERGSSTPYQPRKERERINYHDPNLSELRDRYPGEEFTVIDAVPKSHLSSEIAPLPEKDIIYRGMSWEEYESFRRYGEIKSKGEYNIGSEQDGLTYWATNPETAVTYANSFAPAQFKPTFERPCYVVAAHRPDPKDEQKVAGTGSNEVGISRAIHEDEVVAVWEGKVYDHETGEFDLKPGERGHRMGSATGVSLSVVWSRIA